jgi:vacuolar-type H+-ATPase subunit H
MRPAAQSALHKLSEYIRKTRKSIKQLVDDAQEKSRKILEY